MAVTREFPAVPEVSRFRRFWRAIANDYSRAVQYKHMPIAKSYSQAAAGGTAARAARGA
jgi:hypothetical protein